MVHVPHKRRNHSLLRNERLQRQWSQRELAERVGATVSTVKRWERQISVPGPYFRLKLTALFGKSEEMLGLREAPPPPTTPPSSSEAAGEEHSVPVSITTPPLWTVPYLRNPYFTGRDELFCLLDEHLAATHQDEITTTRRVALTQPQALTGLGGIGKTQIAVEYAYRAHKQGLYTHTLWINAASEEAMVMSFTSLAAQHPEFAASNETDQQKLVDAIKRWLERCPERWLLIFDNADDLSSILHYFPRQGNGSILLTTRAHAVGSFATSIEVEKMSFIEGTSLLRCRAQRMLQLSDDEIKAAGDLVMALDYFPLALDQAGAYIEETECTFDHYLQLSRTQRSALLARRGRQAANYPNSVATTWSLSFEKVKHTNPAAAELLQMCAFLAPDHIPEELFREGAPYWPALLQQAVANPLAFDQMLEILLSFSLVKRLAEDHLLSIHRLVQVMQVEMIDSLEQRQWTERIVRAVNSLFPRQPKEDMNSWPQCLRYLEQVQTSAMLIEHHQLQIVEAADLLDRTGTYLCVHASYSQAEALYQQALHLREVQLGAHHPETAETLHNLGFLSYKQGKYEQAEVFFQQALSLREEQPGVQHLETVRTLTSLGLLCWVQGKYEQAESYHQWALRICEEQLGTQHLEMAETLNNLGILYYCQGKYEQAESYYQRALSLREEQLGPQHPEMALTLNNLGLLFSKQGKYEQAEHYYQRALAIQEEQLGPQHPEMALTLNNLGFLDYQQGRLQQAEHYYQRALAIQEEQLRPQHPETSLTLNNLGLFYYQQGEYEQAESYYQRALAIQEEQLGPQHPETAETLSNLAELYRGQHAYEQAQPLFARALVIQEHTLAAKHPDLARTLHGFARFHEEQGSLQTAAALYQRALTIREQVYGLDHPKTCETRAALREVIANFGIS